ncbi:CAAX prenyl protease-like protein [Mumia flava]|uniref:CAAX prenyl protease-like protein n=1 Tax=Mumia flava TaxID=1348852 RepID=A0A2M9B6H0_9ACTN|nr:CPBP family intramembrane glutamic endopeptidase [Mumia flava]PJJ53539.1 CAAX prenyl protease-like protein [Mumia flava]
MTSRAAVPPPDARERRLLGVEIWIVLLLSLLQSGAYALVSLVAKLTRGPLADQTATLNASRSDRAWLDLTYQLLGIGFALVPVLLVLYLLVRSGDSPRGVLGLGRGSRWGDAGWGIGLAALIGLPGLAFYFAGRAVGITATIVPSALDEHWWTVPVLVLSAVENAVLEEVVVVGYLMYRLTRLGWGPWTVLATSAAVRASYHLYQGIGPAIGNAVMGIVFGYFYQRTGRVVPLIVAHTILDVVAFVGYALLKDPLGLP